MATLPVRPSATNSPARRRPGPTHVRHLAVVSCHEDPAEAVPGGSRAQATVLPNTRGFAQPWRSRCQTCPSVLSRRRLVTALVPSLMRRQQPPSSAARSPYSGP